MKNPLNCPFYSSVYACSQSCLRSAECGAALFDPPGGVCTFLDNAPNGSVQLQRPWVEGGADEPVLLFLEGNPVWRKGSEVRTGRGSNIPIRRDWHLTYHPDAWLV